jgi:hypothetical protein
MSAAATSRLVPELENRAGYLMALRGEKWDGYKPAEHGPLWNRERLPRRYGAWGAHIIESIMNRTYSAFGCPEWCHMSLYEFRQLTGLSARRIRQHLDALIGLGLDVRPISRHPDDPWKFKAHPENFEKAPLLMPEVHKVQKRKPRTANVAAPAAIAALQHQGSPYVADCEPHAIEPAFTDNTQYPTTFGSEACFMPAGDSEGVKPVSMKDTSTLKPVSLLVGPSGASRPGAPPSEGIKNGKGEVNPVSLDAAPGLQLASLVGQSASEIGKRVTGETATAGRPRETFCPWNWDCPHLINGLKLDKPLTLLSLNPKPVGPSMNFDKLKNPAPSSSSAIRGTTTTTEPSLNTNGPDLTPIDNAARQVCNPDSRFARQLFDLCRAQAPDCTVAEVVYFVEEKIAIKRGWAVVNWPGFLMTAVPLHFVGKTLERFRTTQAAPKRMPRENAPASQMDDVRAHLERNAAALPVGYEEIAAKLHDLARDDGDLEALEQRLTELEEKMIATARARQSEEEVLESRRAVDRQLLPYRGKMTPDQLSMLEKQYMEGDLLEKAGLPRLSLFYMH